MPTNIVDVDTWTATIVTAADGDAVNGASRATEAQGLADRSRYLRNRVRSAADGYIGVPIVPAYLSANPTYPVFDSTYCGWRWSNVSAPANMFIGVPEMFNCRITEVHAMFHGDLMVAGPHAGQPANLPTLEVYENDWTGAGTSTKVANITYTWVDIPTYESHQLISATGLTLDMDNSKQVVAEFTGESGANALANSMIFYGLYLKCETL